MNAHVRENWYRDVWLMAITIIVVVIAAKALAVSSTAKHASRTANALSAEIQKERVQSTRNNCLDQNSRHAKTLAELKQIDAESAKTGPRQLIELLGLVGVRVTRAQAQALATFEATAGSSNDEVALLVDRLAPHQNCAVVVAKATGGVKPTLGDRAGTTGRSG